jgi:pimeloyl-ACP methyl ester carboxylesterase
MEAGPPAPPGKPLPDERDVAAANVRLGCVRAGRGPHPVVLLHGWPQTSYAWRRVLPLLRAECSSVALDLRGVGRSSAEQRGFDRPTMAADVRAALASLGFERPLLVGHDMGALVGYAFARRYPADLSGLVIVDTPLPGIAGWEETIASSAYWHLGFHREVTGGVAIADALVAGRQAVYFRSFIDRFAAHPDAIGDADVAVYARGYRGSERLAAGFGMFRAIPLDVADNQAAVEALAVPILVAFSEFCHATVLDTVADGLRRMGAGDVRTAVLEDCGHWPAEERPAALARVIRDFALAVGTS